MSMRRVDVNELRHLAERLTALGRDKRPDAAGIPRSDAGAILRKAYDLGAFRAPDESAIANAVANAPADLRSDADRKAAKGAYYDAAQHEYNRLLVRPSTPPDRPGHESRRFPNPEFSRECESLAGRVRAAAEENPIRDFVRFCERYDRALKVAFDECPDEPWETRARRARESIRAVDALYSPHVKAMADRACVAAATRSDMDLSALESLIDNAMMTLDFVRGRQDCDRRPGDPTLPLHGLRVEGPTGYRMELRGILDKLERRAARLEAASNGADEPVIPSVAELKPSAELTPDERKLLREVRALMAGGGSNAASAFDRCLTACSREAYEREKEREGERADWDERSTPWAMFANHVRDVLIHRPEARRHAGTRADKWEMAAVYLLLFEPELDGIAMVPDSLRLWSGWPKRGAGRTVANQHLMRFHGGDRQAIRSRVAEAVKDLTPNPKALSDLKEHLELLLLHAREDALGSLLEGCSDTIGAANRVATQLGWASNLVPLTLETPDLYNYQRRYAGGVLDRPCQPSPVRVHAIVLHRPGDLDAPSYVLPLEVQMDAHKVGAGFIDPPEPPTEETRRDAVLCLETWLARVRGELAGHVTETIRHDREETARNQIADDEWQPLNQFPVGLHERLKKAAHPKRPTKRVRAKHLDGVRCYSVADARRWWGKEMPPSPSR